MRGQRHAPAATYLRERPGTHCTGGWVDLRAGLDRCGKSRLHRDSIPDRPASRQSLYRLRYPPHALSIDSHKILQNLLFLICRRLMCVRNVTCSLVRRYLLLCTSRSSRGLNNKGSTVAPIFMCRWVIQAHSHTRCK